MFARIKGAVSRAEVERKSERTRRAQLQAAQQGRWLGGGRPFGFEADGVTPRQEEARVVRQVTAAVLAGESLGSLTRQLNEQGVRTTTGRTWSYPTLRQMLMRPRNAGLIAYRGEIVAKSTWPAIVSEESWQAVCALLADPARRRAQSNRPRWLLAGLAKCGAEGCDLTVKSAGTNELITDPAGGDRVYRVVYRCRSGRHVSRTARDVDAFIRGVVIERLSRPDAVDLLVDDSAPDAEALRGEAVALRVRLDELATLYADGTITAAQLATGTSRVRQQIADVDKRQATTARTPVLTDLINAKDVARVWDALPLSRQRAVVDALMVVRILPWKHRTKFFDPAGIEVMWR